MQNQHIPWSKGHKSLAEPIGYVSAAYSTGVRKLEHQNQSRNERDVAPFQRMFVTSGHTDFSDSNEVLLFDMQKKRKRANLSISRRSAPKDTSDAADSFARHRVRIEGKESSRACKRYRQECRQESQSFEHVQLVPHAQKLADLFSHKVLDTVEPVPIVSRPLKKDERSFLSYVSKYMYKSLIEEAPEYPTLDESDLEASTGVSIHTIINLSRRYTPDLLAHLAAHLCFSQRALMTATIYLSRLRGLTRVTLDSLNILLVGALTVAMRATDGSSYNNAIIAMVSGLETADEVTRMASFVLENIDSNTTVMDADVREVEDNICDTYIQQ